MIKPLTLHHKDQVLDFCYAREKENLFVIGSFLNYENTFDSNKFYGYFGGDELVGLGVLFTRFGNLVINALEKKVVEALVDFAIKEKLDIKCTVAFKKYADITIQHLKTNHRKITKKQSEQTVFLLEKANFKNFSDKSETIATKEDIDEIVTFRTGKQQNEITETDREKNFPYQEFLLRKDKKIVSKANIHGVSKNYFQIGGVGTLEAYRGKGYAKQVVSKLCEHFFHKGIKYGLLFTANDNFAAQKIYKSIGFKSMDAFIIAEY